MTKGKELGASSATCPPPPAMSPARGPGERGSPSPPGTARPSTQRRRQTCVHQGAKVRSSIPCPSPGRNRLVPTAASHKALGKILQDHPSSTAGRGSPIQPPFGAGLSPAVDEASCGPAQPSLDVHKDGDSIFSGAGPRAAQPSWGESTPPRPHSSLPLETPAQSSLVLPSLCPPQQPLALASFSISLLSQCFFLLISMCSLGFQAVQIPLGKSKHFHAQETELCSRH